MFDIAFSEIVVIAVVALIVIGPERLPKTARTLGLLFGRLQRYVSDVKADISREMELDELRKLQQQVQSAAREIETSVSSAATDVQAGVRSVEQELNSAAASGDAAGSSEWPVTPPPSGWVQSDLTQPGAPRALPDTGGAAQDPPRQAELPGIDRP